MCRRQAYLIALLTDGLPILPSMHMCTNLQAQDASGLPPQQQRANSAEIAALHSSRALCSCAVVVFPTTTQGLTWLANRRYTARISPRPAGTSRRPRHALPERWLSLPKARGRRSLGSPSLLAPARTHPARQQPPPGAAAARPAGRRTQRRCEKSPNHGRAGVRLRLPRPSAGTGT